MYISEFTFSKLELSVFLVHKDNCHLGTTYIHMYSKTHILQSQKLSLITYGYEPHHQSHSIHRYKQSSFKLLPCLNLTVKIFNNIYRPRINVVFSDKWLDFQWPNIFP